MEIRDKIAVVTGAAAGIGAGLIERFKREGARHLVAADLDGDKVRDVASRVGAQEAVVDVSDEGAIRALVEQVERDHGPVDLMVSNAGFVTIGGVEAPNEMLRKMFDVHVMAHLYAARAVLPSMIARGEGYLLNTASAAGLLSQIGSLHYSVTKHAAVGLAEWLAITHGPQGIKVSVLCPQAVVTDIGKNSPTQDLRRRSPRVASGDGDLTPADVADTVVDALRDERFWVLPHPEVAEYARRKAMDVDRWLRGMQRLQSRLYDGLEPPGDWLDS